LGNFVEVKLIVIIDLIFFWKFFKVKVWKIF
jgi:hypothetical protein